MAKSDLSEYAFVMIGLSVYHEDWKVNRAKPFPTAETNRYFVVARNVVELFNAGDYAAIQKLYDDRGWARPSRRRKLPSFIPASRHISATLKASKAPPPTATTDGPRSGCITSTVSWS